MGEVYHTRDQKLISASNRFFTKTCSKIDRGARGALKLCFSVKQAKSLDS
jgi:hypothetical protein